MYFAFVYVHTAIFRLFAVLRRIARQAGAREVARQVMASPVSAWVRFAFVSVWMIEINGAINPND